MGKYITVSPYYMELKEGEEKQIQVFTEEKEYKVIFVNGEENVEYDDLHNEILGKKAGFSEVKFCIMNDDGTIKDYDMMRIDVVTDNVKSQPVRFMLHNKATNRLNTIISRVDNTTDLVFKIPDTGLETSTLVTQTSIDKGNSWIATPTILSPAYGTNDHDGKFTASVFKAGYGYTTKKQTAERWQVALDKDFKHILDDVTKTENLTKFIKGYFGISVYVRYMQYCGDDHSDWSEPVWVSYNDKTTLTENSNLLYGHPWDGGYYGIMNIDNYIDNRDYRGDWKLLFDNNIKSGYQLGMQVSHNDLLWYCTTAHDLTEDNQPGSSMAYWAVDDREDLPTFKWLLTKIGIGVGVTDNNEDGYSQDNPAIGPLINEDTNKWMKFIYHGKILYIPTHCVTEAICWNDIAKRNNVFGDRTVKINTSTYRIRLLTLEEYNTLLRNMPEKTPYLSNQGIVPMVFSNNEFIQDYQTTNMRNVVKKNGEIQEIDAKSRVGSYRPILELIPKGTEPFNNLPECAKATDENFQYDPYTDTGYFGIVPALDLVDSTVATNTVGWTEGSVLNYNPGWMKFYYQGLIIYVSWKAFRQHYLISKGRSNHALYPMDLGHGNKKGISVNNKRYDYGILNGSRTDPILRNPINYTAGFYNEYGRGSQFTELIYRVADGYMGSNFNGNNYDFYGGWQNGKNWVSQTINSIWTQTHECVVANGDGYSLGNGANSYGGGFYPNRISGGEGDDIAWLSLYLRQY